MHTEGTTPYSSVMEIVQDLESIAIIPPPTWVDPVLAEGYLKKIRGFGQNRDRFFRATSNHFAFYARDCGELISYVNGTDISELRHLGKYRFEVITKVAFGASGAHSMVIEARTPAIKDRWLAALHNMSSNVGGDLRGEGGAGAQFKVLSLHSRWHVHFSTTSTPHINADIYRYTLPHLFSMAIACSKCRGYLACRGLLKEDTAHHQRIQSNALVYTNVPLSCLL